MDIVEELRKDRESGAKRLVAEYKAGLMTLARRFCHDPGDAEELVNRTFAEVVEGIDDYVEQSAFFGWMCQILVNLNANDNRRRSNGEIVYPGVVPDVADEEAEGGVYKALDAALLRDAIETLPDDIRKTLMMHYFAGFSIKDIARFLAIPVGTVKWRLLHARQILAVKMGAAASEAVKKPGVKATLIVLALCAVTALGAGTRLAVARLLSSPQVSAEQQADNSKDAGGPRFVAAANTGGATSPLPAVAEDGDPPATTAVPEVPFVPEVPSTTFSGETTMNTTLRTIAASAAFAAASGAALNANADYEEWSGDDLVIHGDKSAGFIYEKKMDGESLSAANITLATEVGRARIVAINNSTITASTAFYLGKEASPGDYGLISTVVLTNSTLTTPDLYLGYNVRSYSDNTRLFMEIGPGSIVDCAKITRWTARNPVVKFTGGRMVFSGDDQWWQQNWKYRWLVYVEERSCAANDYSNGGIEFRGEGAPIDIEINKNRELAHGLRGRNFTLSGNGGFIKRGTGTMLWAWHTEDVSGEFKSIVNYTGDTVIKGGAIQLMNTSVSATDRQHYATPIGSVLKIEAGAMFNLNGYPASFLGVSGAGMITNSAATTTTLTLGESGGDGEFSPAIIGGEFNLVKRGAGTLTIGKATLAGSLSATGGTVIVASGASFICRDIALDGTTLDIRGARVTCDNLTHVNGATILRDAATVLRVGPGATVMVFK